MKYNVTRFPQIFTFLAMMSITTTLAWAQMASQPYLGHDAVANEVLIKFQQPAPNDAQGQAEIAADIQQAELAGDIDAARAIGSAGWMLFRSRSNDVTTLMSIHTGAPGVVHVEPNWVSHVTNTPNDPLFTAYAQWGLLNVGQQLCGLPATPGADIGATSAWSIKTGSSSILVGVDDTGVDYTHPDLAANVWSAPSQFSFLQGTTEYTCPAGTHGWNALTATCDPMDDNGHGTHLSGIIGAVGNNDIGIAGVNWTTMIIAAKMCDVKGKCSNSYAIDALQFMEGVKTYFYGSSANIRVLNNSWGGAPFQQALLDEIDNAYTADMLFVASAGDSGTDNDTTPTYPASYSAPNVVAVAATDSADYLASTTVDGFSSNYGPSSVALGAPGVCIISTWPGGQYKFLGGTSMASPHVAGTAALSLSECGGDTDWLKPNLLNNVVKTSALTGKTITGGRVNAYNSLYAGSNACPGTGSGMVSGFENSRVVYQNGHYVTVYDSGTINVVVNGSTKTVSYDQYSTAYGLAILLSSQINNDGTYVVRAHRLGSTLYPSFSDVPLTAKTTGPGTCYTLSAYSTWNTTYFPQPSFSINPSGTALVGCK